MLKTLSKLNTCVYYWNSVENTPNNYGKRFPPLLRVFPATPTVVNNSVGNGFYDAFPGNSSTQNELKSKKRTVSVIILIIHLSVKSFLNTPLGGLLGEESTALPCTVVFSVLRFSSAVKKHIHHQG